MNNLKKKKEFRFILFQDHPNVTIQIKEGKVYIDDKEYQHSIIDLVNIFQLT